MKTIFPDILAKHEDAGGLPLTVHLEHVAKIAEKIAVQYGMPADIAGKGAVLHDIGKVSPLFQQTMRHGFIRPPDYIFRHEIASLFFLSMVDDDEKGPVTEMIAAHHKSICKDVGGLGLLDLDEDEDAFGLHSAQFERWVPSALEILEKFGFNVHPLTLEEARSNYDYAVSYCENLRHGCSMWKGLLMAADQMASALEPFDSNVLDKLFIIPDLSFYDRENELYPLSMRDADDSREHTMVTAPTGAGKTDFLMRRCRGRVFYILPYQASINAMYDRFRKDLENTGARICLQHASSDIKVQDHSLEERILQRHVGASIKVLTPHQIASAVFGVKGYEALLLDMKGCDVVLDEIHTYSNIIQAIVLRIVEILVRFGCRIHVGTATMPQFLYDKIFDLLGGHACVYEVKLTDDVLRSFNRHVIHKISGFEDARAILRSSVSRHEKILVVCNQVKRAQELYKYLAEQYPAIPKMIIHSHFKRMDRQRLETELKETFNVSDDACIVVSTQVVEVSLDISFDVMITECAPIESMIQRFGRINRKRTLETIGKFRPVYVMAPFHGKDALPYDHDILCRSYDVLPDNAVLEEAEIQNMLDRVYPEGRFTNIDYAGAVYANGRWVIRELRHNSRSALLDALEIESVTCITRSDEEEYEACTHSRRSALEIPVSFRSVAYLGLRMKNCGSCPYVIPDKAYDNDMGLSVDSLKAENNRTYDFL